MSITVMKQAMDAAESAMRVAIEYIDKLKAENKSLRQAIAEAEKQEPDDLTIAYMSGVYDGKKQRQPLTDEQIAVACGWMPEKGCKPLPNELKIARAIEAAHGIKENT